MYIADCNNHCIRLVQYDVGDAKTVEFKGIQSNEAGEGINDDNDETEGTKTNKSGIGDDDYMPLECDGNMCYPKFF